MNNSKYDCLHCKFDREYRSLERGKIQLPITPYSDTKVKGFPDVIDCPACDGTGYLHQDIVDSLEKYCGNHNCSMEELIGLLKNGSDHFYFWRNNMYHGVEFTKEHRGYIHT